uniref:Rid family hydrolase n=1 Tax=Pseudomonas sp. MD332_6 TaxID=3241256 RepID=UPI0036D41CC2
NTNERLSGAVTFNVLVFLSGHVPGDGQDVATQTREVQARIDALLAQAGSDKDHFHKATIYLKDIDSGYAPMNEVRS